MDKPSSLGAFPSHLGPSSRGPIPGNQPQALEVAEEKELDPPPSKSRSIRAVDFSEFESFPTVRC